MTTADMDIRADAVPGWNDTLTNPLRVAGPVRQTLEGIVVNRDPGGYLNNTSILISDGMTTSYAGGILSDRTSSCVSVYSMTVIMFV